MEEKFHELIGNIHSLDNQMGISDIRIKVVEHNAKYDCEQYNHPDLDDGWLWGEK